MPADIITVRNLTKKFGRFTAVDSINFKVKKGQILGFIGPNGAGKTTAIKMINGLLKVTSGEIFIKGMDVAKNRKEIKKIIGYMSQKFSLYPLLSAVENTEFFAGISGLSRYSIKNKLEELRKMIPGNLQSIKVSDLPPGIKQKVALFVSLISDPEIIFLDEPTSGVDPRVRRDFWYQIYNLKKTGKTILVTTHNLDEVEYTDRVVLIHRGKIILKGAPDELQKQHHKDSFQDLFKEAILNFDKGKLK